MQKEFVLIPEDISYTLGSENNNTLKGLIIATGNFGLHIINNPAGTFSFVGTVPATLSHIVSDTFDSALFRMFTWLDSIDDIDERKTFVVALRNDIFAKYLGR